MDVVYCMAVLHKRSRVAKMVGKRPLATEAVEQFSVGVGMGPMEASDTVAKIINAIRQAAATATHTSPFTVVEQG